MFKILSKLISIDFVRTQQELRDCARSSDCQNGATCQMAVDSKTQKYCAVTSNVKFLTAVELIKLLKFEQVQGINYA